MFTGIVDHLGEILFIEQQEKSLRLTIKTQFADLVMGESIAIDGICLTVVSFAPQKFCVDVSLETLRVSAAQNFLQGTRVNLERAMRMSDRLGGHFVLGHVDCTARLEKRCNHDEYVEWVIGDIDAHDQQYLIAKGSVTVNGVSLTINSVHTGGFSVMLIPHTLARTNWQFLTEDARVNIEFDYLAKLVLNKTREIALEVLS